MDAEASPDSDRSSSSKTIPAMVSGVSTAASTSVTHKASAANVTSLEVKGLIVRIWWNDPYLLGSLAILITAILTLCFSLLLVCHRLHHFHYCSLFLVEMAVGCLTTEAIVHLLPALILADAPPKAKGMPWYFPHLATVTAGVCVLHLLDTASVVFFGRRQSTSHAMEWRNHHHPHTELEEVIAAGRSQQQDLDELDAPQEEGEGGSSGGGNVIEASLKFPEDGSSSPHEITLRQALARPRLCLRPGPYRLCSIVSAGSILHSFADGVAIGAAFVKSWESGLHLSLSVGMHELAIKVADFAVLTSAGFVMPAILMLNGCYWVAAFIGLFIAVSLSQKSDVLRIWIMTVVTAMFMYISLVTMSSMVRRIYLPRQVSAFLIGNAGMTTGYIMIMLASVLDFFY